MGPCYGIISGSGMGYICPVALLTKWFPDRRGLMTGVAVIGYGAGAVIVGLIAPDEIISTGVFTTFLAFGIAYIVLVVTAAQANPQFRLLWFMLFLNVPAGIMIINQASPMGRQMVKLTAVIAAGIVPARSICKAVGRVFWPRVSEFIGCARVYLFLYAVLAVVFFLLPRFDSVALFTASMAMIGLCYGGGFGTMPAFTADFFGTRKMGGTSGCILPAWALSMPRVRETSGNDTDAVRVIAIVMLLSAALPLLAKRPAKEEVRHA
jgi:MFS transporter, OFA family, oxalate/formate antiporter